MSKPTTYYEAVMQIETYATLEEAIQGGNKMLEERPFDMSTSLIVPEVFKTHKGYVTVLPDSYFEERSYLGDKIGYVDGNRFSTVEEVRAETKRDEEIEFAADEYWVKRGHTSNK